MSNRFNRRRQLQVRPAVCRPRPPPPPPGPTFTASIEPDPAGTFSFDRVSLDCKACNGNIFDGQQVALSLVSGGAFDWQEQTLLNCDTQVEGLLLFNEETPGLYNLVTRFTWAEGTLDHPHVVEVF